MKNPVAKALRTPKFKPKKVESKKKYSRKPKVNGYYYDGYEDKFTVLDDEKFAEHCKKFFKGNNDD